MDLDKFADFRVSVDEKTGDLLLRHQNCERRYVERIPLEKPIRETNLKWLMLRATLHWKDQHS